MFRVELLCRIPLEISSFGISLRCQAPTFRHRNGTPRGHRVEPHGLQQTSQRVTFLEAMGALTERITRHCDAYRSRLSRLLADWIGR
jgi:hypothetical protein